MPGPRSLRLEEVYIKSNATISKEEKGSKIMHANRGGRGKMAHLWLYTDPNVVFLFLINEVTTFDINDLKENEKYSFSLDLTSSIATP